MRCYILLYLNVFFIILKVKFNGILYALDFIFSKRKGRMKIIKMK